ncbi:hypothetical protein C0991_005884, partial [Blastosporella zonata]
MAANSTALLSMPPQSKQNTDYGFSVRRGAFHFDVAVGRWHQQKGKSIFDVFDVFGKTSKTQKMQKMVSLAKTCHLVKLVYLAWKDATTSLQDENSLVK